MYIWLQIMSSNNFEENNPMPWLLIVLLQWSSFHICWWCRSSLFQPFKVDHYHHHHHQSHDRCGRWGERMDTSTNNDLPICLSWAAPSISFNLIPVHSFILSTCFSAVDHFAGPLLQFLEGWFLSGYHVTAHDRTIPS